MEKPAFTTGVIANMSDEIFEFGDKIRCAQHN